MVETQKHLFRWKRSCMGVQKRTWLTDTRSTPIPHLAVAVACQLRNEAHVVLPDLDHLLADVVLGAAACGGAGPPGRREMPLSVSSRRRGQFTGPNANGASPGFVLLEVGAGLYIPRQLDLHVTEERHDLELLWKQKEVELPDAPRFNE